MGSPVCSDPLTLLHPDGAFAPQMHFKHDRAAIGENQAPSTAVAVFAGNSNVSLAAVAGRT
jgi:hypothetical protein